jgi:hypothetical protein
MIGVKVIPEQLAVVKAFQALDAEGHLIRPEDRAQLQRVVSELILAAKDTATVAA